MPDTPILLKGKFYNTSRVRKCPSFNQCVACKKCTNFDQHSAMCKECERGQSYTCSHTEKQKSTFIQIETRMKRPMFELDAKIDAESNQRQYIEETELIQLEAQLAGLGVTAQHVAD